MFDQRFFVEGLAHASYLVGAGGEAAVVDPKRDVDDYLDTAQREKLKVVAVLETHPHGDFVSGHVELAQRTGAKIYLAPRARPLRPRARSRRRRDSRGSAGKPFTTLGQERLCNWALQIKDRDEFT